MAAVQAERDERDEVERPILAQLEAMGWTHVPGTEVGTLDDERRALCGGRSELDELGRRMWMGEIA